MSSNTAEESDMEMRTVNVYMMRKAGRRVSAPTLTETKFPLSSLLDSHQVSRVLVFDFLQEHIDPKDLAASTRLGEYVLLEMRDAETNEIYFSDFVLEGERYKSKRLGGKYSRFDVGLQRFTLSAAKEREYARQELADYLQDGII